MNLPPTTAQAPLIMDKPVKSEIFDSKQTAGEAEEEEEEVGMDEVLILEDGEEAEYEEGALILEEWEEEKVVIDEVLLPGDEEEPEHEEEVQEPVAAFQAAMIKLRNGHNTCCPFAKFKSCLKETVPGSEAQPFKARNPWVLAYHGLMVHNIPYKFTTEGGLSCSSFDPTTKIVCGYRFKRLDKLEAHQKRRFCLGQSGKQEQHLSRVGCSLFVKGKLCGKKFSNAKCLRRHLVSKMHGGRGARAQYSG